MFLKAAANEQYLVTGFFNVSENAFLNFTIIGVSSLTSVSLGILSGSFIKSKDKTPITKPTPPMSDKQFLHPIMLMRIMLSAQSPPPKKSEPDNNEFAMGIFYFETWSDTMEYDAGSLTA